MKVTSSPGFLQNSVQPKYIEYYEVHCTSRQTHLNVGGRFCLAGLVGFSVCFDTEAGVDMVDDLSSETVDMVVVLLLETLASRSLNELKVLILLLGS